MAKSPAPPAVPLSNRERPADPKPFEATKEQLLDFYKQMLLIRRFEERSEERRVGKEGRARWAAED